MECSVSAVCVALRHSAFSITTDSIMTLSIMTFCVMTYSITTLSIIAEYCYAECRLCWVSQISPVMLSFIKLNDVMLNAVMLSVVALSVLLWSRTSVFQNCISKVYSNFLRPSLTGFCSLQRQRLIVKCGRNKLNKTFPSSFALWKNKQGIGNWV